VARSPSTGQFCTQSMEPPRRIDGLRRGGVPGRRSGGDRRPGDQVPGRRGRAPL